MVYQIIYDKESANLIYLSPYTDVTIKDNDLIIKNPQNMKIVKLSFKNGPYTFLSMMAQGITYEGLLSFFEEELLTTKLDAQNVIRLLVKNNYLE